MVNSVSQPPITPTTPKSTKVSIFYVNDIHANIDNMGRLKTAYDEFKASDSSKSSDKLVFVSGDTSIGGDIKSNKLAVAFQNGIDTMASTAGNHEFDAPEANIIEASKDAKYKILGLNTNIDPSKELSKIITKAYIQEQNGEKYGIIGLIPFDMNYHLKDPQRFDYLNLMDLEKTIPQLQKQIDDFKKQGIDKIILVSHVGLNCDREIAQRVEGIDTILSSHSHEVLEGIKEGENLFYSKKTGEPTIITQAGKDGKYFGILNLEFNDKGVIVKAQNNVNKSENFPKSVIMSSVTDKILGSAEIVGTINSVQPYPKNSLIEENPHFNFIADAVKSELNPDIVMFNSANIRGAFTSGSVSDRDIKAKTPLDNRLALIKLNEKELVDTIKVGAKSMTTSDHTPGLLNFSGIRYTVSKSGEVKEIKFIDKSGKEIAIDVNNPNIFKTYIVVTDDFVAKGGNNYLSTNKWDDAEIQFEFDKDKLVADYIRKLNKPVDIKADGRIQIVD